MHVATQANGRTAYAASDNSKDNAAGGALEVAFSGGSIVGMVVVGLGLIGLAIAGPSRSSGDSLFSLPSWRRSPRRPMSGITPTSSGRNRSGGNLGTEIPAGTTLTTDSGAEYVTSETVKISLSNYRNAKVKITAARSGASYNGASGTVK